MSGIILLEGKAFLSGVFIILTRTGHERLYINSPAGPNGLLKL